MDQIFLGNRYELHEEIGSGGMAHVFKARDTLLDRTVAIKILKPEYTEDAQFIERFRVEAKAAASLSNANIVMIYDVGQDDGVYYIIMEYVDGITLKEYVANAGPLPWKEAVTIALQVTQAIDTAHSNKIIHRDIKPQNVLITRDRKIKITDFGIARAASSMTITTVGNAMGSVHYFSPEQAKGSLTDEKSDIYSLGITLYEMLTGTVPFEGETPIAVALKHIQEPPVEPSRVNPQIPPGLNAIVLKSIAKDKFDRYQSMGEMLVDLKKVMKDPSGASLQYAAAYNTAYAGGAVNANGFAYANNAGANANGFAYANNAAYANGGAYPNGGDDPYNNGGGEYAQNAYAQDIDGDFDSGRAAGADGYADNYGGAYNNTNDYQDDGYADGPAGYANGAAPPDEDMSGGARRQGGARRPQQGMGYQGSGGARGNPNQRREAAARRDGFSRNGAGGGGRRGNDGGQRGGYTGVFIVIVLVAVLAAIGFVIWIMNSLFNIIQPPANQGRDEESFTVGNYVRREFEEVYDELRGEGIKSEAVRVENNSAAPGTIVRQSIPEGRILRRNGPEIIEFEVSDGPRRFTIPDYNDYESDSRAAEAELRANGFEVTVVSERSNTVREGYVIRTDPEAGSQPAAGANVTIYRSSGSDVSRTVVPQLLGRTYREVLEILDEARLGLGAISPENVRTSDIVIRQSLTPNSVVDEGVSIDLWFEEPEISTAEPESTTEATTETTPADASETTSTASTEDTTQDQGTQETPTEADSGQSTQETTTAQSDTQPATTGGGQPISKSILLHLPAENNYDDVIKVLVEATPSDSKRTERLVNRSVMKDDFPKNVEFTIPPNGSVEIKVYYEGVLMQTKVFRWDE